MTDQKCKVPCIVTGTRAYGPHHETADIDIVMKLEHAQSLLNYLQEKQIPVQQTESQIEYAEGGGFYFYLNNMLCFNIIVAEDEHEYVQWEDATLFMREHTPFENRDERIDFFRSHFHGEEHG